MGITLMLGRDGMGDSYESDFERESDFDRWVQYVADRICDRTAIPDVSVESRRPRDVQDDAILGADDEERSIVRSAKEALWEEWCAEGAAAS